MAERKDLNEEERRERLAKRREMEKNQRHNETPEEREERLRKNRERKQVISLDVD